MPGCSLAYPDIRGNASLSRTPLLRSSALGLLASGNISRVRDRHTTHTRTHGTHCIPVYSRNLDITESLFGLFFWRRKRPQWLTDASYRIFDDSKSCGRLQFSAAGIPPCNTVTRVRIILHRLYAIRCDNRVSSIDGDRRIENWELPSHSRALYLSRDRYNTDHISLERWL